MRLIALPVCLCLGMNVWLSAAATELHSPSPPTCSINYPGRTGTALAGEIAAGSELSLPLSPAFSLRLEPVDHGWQLRVRDTRGLDLSMMTPPRFGPNPRDIVGWHFRSADNASANDGSVNAPRRLRLFEFEPGLAGTGGIKAPKDAQQAAAPGAGRGWLYIRELGLDAFTGTGPGEKARAVWLRFDACLSWPEATDPGADAGRLTDEEVEILYDCGLEPGWNPVAWLMPRWLGGDFDGDGALDQAAPIARGEERAIAICLAGEQLRTVGAGGLQLGDNTDVASLEAWRVEETGRGSPDELRLIRIEKSEHAVTAVDSVLRAETLYRIVTPEPT